MKSLIVFLMLVTPAQAHGVYAWINDGRYKNADGVHCCGPADCIPRTAGQIHRMGDGSFTVQMPARLMRVPAKAVYQGRDPFWRACSAGCLFSPWRGY